MAHAVNHWGDLVIVDDDSAQAALPKAEPSQWTGREAQQEKSLCWCMGHKSRLGFGPAHTESLKHKIGG